MFDTENEILELLMQCVKNFEVQFTPYEKVVNIVLSAAVPAENNNAVYMKTNEQAYNLLMELISRIGKAQSKPSLDNRISEVLFGGQKIR